MLHCVLQFKKVEYFVRLAQSTLRESILCGTSLMDIDRPIVGRFRGAISVLFKARPSQCVN